MSIELDNSAAAAAAAVVGAPKGAIWQRKGRIIRDPACIAANQEINVIYEPGSHLLSLDPGEPVFKAWFSGGNTGNVVGAGGSGGMYYAESRNGTENWVQRAQPVIPTVSRCSIVKHSGTYYIYSGPYEQRFSSADGITFSAGQQIVFDGSPLAWEAGGKQNTCTWIEPNGTWIMLYEGAGIVGNVWQVGLATSSDGVNWVRSSANPVLAAGNGLNSVSVPDTHKIGEWYWGWFHGATTNAQGSSTTLPTDVYRARSRDLTTWERTPSYPVYSRATADEGAGSVQGQNADVCLIEVSGRVYMYHTAFDGAVQVLRNPSLKCAVANCTFEQLVQTNEGDSHETPTRDAMGGLAITESVSVGEVTGEYYEKIRIRTNSLDARAVSINHRGFSTALEIKADYPCPLLLELGEGANYCAPLKFNAGAVLTTPMPGAIEFDGTNLYFTTAAGVRKTITAT